MRPAFVVIRQPDLHRLVCLLLHTYGCLIRSFLDNHACWEAMQASPLPVLVIIDNFQAAIPLNQLPQMTAQLAPIFRRHVTILLDNGNGERAAYVQRHYPDMPITFLRKPFLGQQLAEVIAQALTRLAPYWPEDDPSER